MKKVVPLQQNQITICRWNKTRKKLALFCFLSPTQRSVPFSPFFPATSFPFREKGWIGARSLFLVRR